MEAEVIYYCEDHNDVNFSSLTKYFGDPEDVARDFLSELGESTLTKSNDIKQHLIRIALLIVIVVIIFVAGIRIYTDYKQQQALDGFYIEEITYEGDVAPYTSDIVYFSETFGE